MGNQICCQQPTSQQHKQDIMFKTYHQNNPQTSQSHIHQHHQLNQQLKNTLPQQIKAIVQKFKPFQTQFNSQQDIKIKKYGNDIYEGPIDLINRPIKIGKMYKQNGAYFIGNFVSGKAQGPCFYVMKDGSYYKGLMKDNHAECQDGNFVTKTFQYFGGFKDNLFHGKGKQRTNQNSYSFQGMYQNGKKRYGIMKWWQNNHHQYIYQGSLNQNSQFNGKGKLIDPQGTYQGQFLNGQKHGYGVYKYKSQLRYEGFYSHNKKQGQGQLFNNDNTIAYKGIFKNGMPHGKGIATTKNGNEFQTQWVDGIDKRLL